MEKIIQAGFANSFEVSFTYLGSLLIHIFECLFFNMFELFPYWTRRGVEFAIYWRVPLYLLSFWTKLLNDLKIHIIGSIQKMKPKLDDTCTTWFECDSLFFVTFKTFTCSLHCYVILILFHFLNICYIHYFNILGWFWRSFNVSTTKRTLDYYRNCFLGDWMW